MSAAVTQWTKENARATVVLGSAQLQELAALVADEVEHRRQAPLPLVGVAEVAAYLDVEASWVYEHADEIGVRRLGDGPKARLRFNLAVVDERLAARSTIRKSSAPKSAKQSHSRKRTARGTGTNVSLLPIRGSDRADKGLREAS